MRIGQAQLRGLDREAVFAGFLALAGELDDENRVLAREADQHHDLITPGC